MRLIPIEGKQNDHLYRHPKTGVIYFSQYRKGLGRKEVSLKTDNINEARKEADRIRQEWLGLKPKQKTVKLFDELWSEFLETKKTKSKNHFENIESRGRLHILPFFKDWYVSDINQETGKLYAKAKWDETPGRKLFNDIKSLNMFLKYCFNTGAITKGISFEYPDPPREKGKVYSDYEIKRLLDVSPGSDLSLQILMGVTMGMRLSEILFLTWERVDLENKVIHLRAEDTKIRQARSFGISAPVLELLQIKHTINKDLGINAAFVFNHPNDLTKPLGRNGNKRAWATAKRKAKVEGRFHELRHTFLTNAFKSTVNPALICHFAGLSLEEASKTYLHFTVEDTRAVSNLIEVKS